MPASFKKLILRGLLTTINVHVLGAICVGIASMGPAHGIPAGIFFAILGCPYLVIEAPVILLSQLLLDRIRSRSLRTATALSLVMTGAMLGYHLCFHEGGEKPGDYALGFTVAGGLGAAVTVLSALMIPVNRTTLPSDGKSSAANNRSSI